MLTQQMSADTEDDFGRNDADWDVYRQLNVRPLLLSKALTLIALVILITTLFMIVMRQVRQLGDHDTDSEEEKEELQKIEVLLEKHAPESLLSAAERNPTHQPLYHAARAGRDTTPVDTYKPNFLS